MKKFFIVYLILIMLAIVGYVRCWYRFCTSDFDPINKREIVYGIGCSTGTGVIIGFLDIEDSKPSTPNR